MRIGLSQRVVTDPQHGERRDALAHDWLAFLSEINLCECAFPIPNSSAHVESWLNAAHLDAVILTGGNDVGESEERDYVENTILQYSITNNVPVFGTCRGLHLINLFFGGGITRRVSDISLISHVAQPHQISIIDASFSNRFDKSSAIVNSFHNQAVTQAQLSPRLQCFATTEDGVVEGIYSEDYPIMAVQWHPERDSPDHSLNLQMVSDFLLRKYYWITTPEIQS